MYVKESRPGMRVARKSKRRPAGPALLKRRLVWVALFLVSTLGFAWACARWWYPLPDLGKGSVATVRLYAGSEEIAAYWGTSRCFHIWLPLDKIPPHVVNAVLAAEDRRFFHHPGIDVRAILRAALMNLRQRGVRQGGSTITQQLARTLFLRTERTWGRKLLESGAALLIEIRYPKSLILEAYLNTVYMGHDENTIILGMGAACRHFLGKNLTDIRLDEAALLAAAIRAPNRTFFGQNPGVVKVRRNWVLRTMRDLDPTTETAVREAISRPLKQGPTRHRDEFQYFADLAREEIARRVSLPKSGEAHIMTTLDPQLQRAAIRGICEGVERIERENPSLERGRVQAALVAIQPSSGAIRALVGGRSYHESSFNRATRSARQPGSLFKPFVYLAAFEAQSMGRKPGITPASLVCDDPTSIPNGTSTWSPQNYDHQFRGQVTVRRALEASLNVPAVRIACEVGLNEVARLARALGIARPLAEVPSLALGTSEVTLLEITAAYATLANQGIRAWPTTLAPDVPVQGRVDIEPLSAPERVVSAESAFMITHLLRGVLRYGTGRATARWGLSNLGAGKTGTTSGLRDAWFIGYTPDLAIGVWVGLDDGSPLGIPGSKAALPIWAMVMQTVVQRKPPGTFTQPPGIVMASIDPDTGRRALPECSDGPTIVEAFRAGSEPRASACDRPPMTGIIESFGGWFERLFPTKVLGQSGGTDRQ